MSQCTDGNATTMLEQLSWRCIMFVESIGRTHEIKNETNPVHDIKKTLNRTPGFALIPLGFQGYQGF
jgi:hypothetical protein